MLDTILALKELQEIDTRLDEIIELRGDLPNKIVEIDEEISIISEKYDKFNSRFKEINDELHRLEEEINHNKVELAHDEENFKSVTNNKEYDAITLQINARKDKISENEKIISELNEKREKLEVHVNQYRDDLAELNNQKSSFESELDEKIVETEKEEKSLKKKRKAAESKVDSPYDKLYNTIRTSKNLTVSVMTKNSCTGCRSIIPLQQQAEIRNRKKIIICESCGRILIDHFKDDEEEK